MLFLDGLKDGLTQATLRKEIDHLTLVLVPALAESEQADSIQHSIESARAAIESNDFTEAVRVIRYLKLREKGIGLGTEFGWSKASEVNSMLDIDISLQPPADATRLLFLLVPRDDREHVVGDLDEAFQIVVERTDTRFARRWYWFQAVRTVAYYPLRSVTAFAERVIIGVVSNLMGP